MSGANIFIYAWGDEDEPMVTTDPPPITTTETRSGT